MGNFANAQSLNHNYSRLLAANRELEKAAGKIETALAGADKAHAMYNGAKFSGARDKVKAEKKRALEDLDAAGKANQGAYGSLKKVAKNVIGAQEYRKTCARS